MLPLLCCTYLLFFRMKRIFLIGYMGCGKTTVGSLLALKLGYSFIDLDTYIENRYVKKIAEIFAEKGENTFREIEHRMLAEVSELENVVVSTGGGAACFFNNIEIMNKSGISVYLKLSAKKLAERLHKAKAMRPLIKDKTDEELPVFISDGLSKREKFYMQASFIINNEDMDPTPVCDKIISIVNNQLA